MVSGPRSGHGGPGPPACRSFPVQARALSRVAGVAQAKAGAHRVRQETPNPPKDAEGLAMVSSRFGRLMLQGTVNRKCYRLLEPVPGCRHAAVDRKRGGTA